MTAPSQVALVTGAASGIGKAAALAFAKEGVAVVVADVQQKEGESVVSEIKAGGGWAAFVLLDVADESSWKVALAQSLAAFKKVTILVNNAGITGPPGLFEDYDMAVYENVIRISSTSMFLGCKTLAKELKRHAEKACVVNVASVLSLVATGFVPGRPAYGAAKGACLMLTKNLAVEWAPSGVRVNSVHPGYIETAMAAQLKPEDAHAVAAKHPLGRLGKPDEIASAIVFLASSGASFITGSALYVDGGYTAV